MKMPTIGIQPSLQSTRLVGAVLMHQFARDRFTEAGISEELIREAEERENLDCLVASTIKENGISSNDSGADISTNTIEDYGASDSSIVTGEISNINDTSTLSKVSTTLVNDSRSEHDLTANHPSNNSNRNDVSGDQYHSMAESLGCNNNTIYHSINAGSNSNAHPVNLERLQSLPAMTHYGRQLRLLAEEFEKDRKRLAVKDHANKVELKEITKENFVKLLEELFQDRITREKIVVLFFFCTDVALRAASFAQDLVVQLLGWSFSYIINTVCRIVHELGGWDNLLFRQLPSVLVTCCAALGICALSIYLFKSLRSDHSNV